MAGREMKYEGIWSVPMPMSEMKDGERAGSNMASQLTVFRCNPSPETWAAFEKMANEFKKFWGPRYASMMDEQAAQQTGQQTAGKPGKSK